MKSRLYKIQCFRTHVIVSILVTISIIRVFVVNIRIVITRFSERRFAVVFIEEKVVYFGFNLSPLLFKETKFK